MRTLWLVLVFTAVIAFAAPNARRVSVGKGGSPPDGMCREPRFSPNGRLVLFTSTASNLVSGDTNHALDVFSAGLGRRGSIERLSPEWQGTDDLGVLDSYGVSEDGGMVVFIAKLADPAGGSEVRIYDRQMKSQERMVTDQKFLSVQDVAISGDGRFVFFSNAPKPTAGATPGSFTIDPSTSGVFVYDRQTHAVDRVSPQRETLMSDRLSAISPDGRCVVYVAALKGSVETDFPLVIYDRVTKATERVADKGPFGHVWVSASGNLVIFTQSDKPNEWVPLVRDRAAGNTEALLPKEPAVTMRGPSFSVTSNGNLVAFDVELPPTDPPQRRPPTEIVIYDRTARTFEHFPTFKVTGRNDIRGRMPSLSADGRMLAFVAGEGGRGSQSSSVYVSSRTGGDLPEEPESP